MKFLEAKVENFGSYKHLKFHFTKLGLCLVVGDTGAGKSTIQDLIPWILFGKTARGSKIDEILSWGAEGQTKGTLKLLDSSENLITVERKRGPKGNSLFYTIGSEKIVVGSNSTQTQKMLEDTLGISFQSYCLSFCFNEFSNTSNFFVNDSKSRKILLDNICNLYVPNTLKEKSKTLKSESIKYINEKTTQLILLDQGIKFYKSSLESLNDSSEDWKRQKEKNIQKLEKMYENLMEAYTNSTLARVESIDFELKNNFDFIKDNDKTIENLRIELEKEKQIICTECKRPIVSDYDWALQITELTLSNRSILSAIKLLEIEKDILLSGKPDSTIYEDQIKSALKEENPYPAKIELIQKSLSDTSDTRKLTYTEICDLENKKMNFEILEEVSDELKKTLLDSTVSWLEQKTNEYLSKYFSDEIQVSLSAKDSNDFDAIIRRGQFECSYTQLSRGQRSLLKLCFGVASMELSSNNSGVATNCIFFDECLDGMSSELKLNAVRLFQELETKYSTVMVVDHAVEIRSQFDNTIEVTIDYGKSSLRFL